MNEYTSKRIAALQQLSRTSDDLRKLNEKVERAADTVGRIYAKANRRGLETALDKLQTLRKELAAMYADSVKFSADNGIAILPKPTGLLQRSSR